MRRTIYTSALMLLCGAAMAQQGVSASISFPSGEWMEPLPVSVKISKGALTGFGKVQLSVSSDVEVSPISRMGATFSQSKGQVKFLWMDMPSGDMEVTMLVHPKQGAAKDLSISGAFYCLDENGNPIHSSVATQSQGKKEVAAKEPVRQRPAQQPESKRQEEPAPAVASAPETRTVSWEPVRTETYASDSETKPLPARQESNTGNSETLLPAQRPRASSAPSQPVPGLVFRAQVAAQRSHSSPERVRSRLLLPQEIHYDFHEDWHKYTTGEFTNYRAAKAYANELRDTNQAPGSFVVGFENGQRISIQRAIELAK